MACPLLWIGNFESSKQIQDLQIFTNYLYVYNQVYEYQFFMKFKLNRLVLLFAFFIFNSCKDRETESPSAIEISEGNMMLVCNEGNFRWGNASLGLFNFQNNIWIEDAFKTKNKRSLGDVCQSACFVNKNWWVVVNNSAKIEVISPYDFSSLYTISGFISPRFALPVSNSKVYVSDIYAKKVWIVNVDSKAITGTIPFPGAGEEMVLENDRAWVICSSKSKVFLIETQTDQLVDSIEIPGKGTSIAKGPSGKIWVGYDSASTGNPGILLIDATTKTIERQFVSTGSKISPTHFQTSATGDSVFFLSDGANLLKRSDSQYPGSRLITGITGNWYGFGYDNKRQEVYLSDAKDYVQKSRIIKKNMLTGLQTDFVGGVISSRFYFW